MCSVSSFRFAGFLRLVFGFCVFFSRHVGAFFGVRCFGVAGFAGLVGRVGLFGVVYVFGVSVFGFVGFRCCVCFVGVSVFRVSVFAAFRRVGVDGLISTQRGWRFGVSKFRTLSPLTI